MQTNSLVVRAYVVRGARLWLVTRALLAAVFFFGQADPIRTPTLGAALIILSVVGVSVLETHQRGEFVFLANLGVRPGMIAAMFAAPATVAEVALQSLASLF